MPESTTESLSSAAAVPAGGVATAQRPRARRNAWTSAATVTVAILVAASAASAQDLPDESSVLVAPDTRDGVTVVTTDTVPGRSCRLAVDSPLAIAVVSLPIQLGSPSEGGHGFSAWLSSGPVRRPSRQASTPPSACGSTTRVSRSA